MSVFIALTIGLVFWLSAWAFGLKAFDAFIVTVLLTLGAATARIIAPFVNQLLGRESADYEELGAAERN
jgi:hypothetical protein